VTDQHLAGDLSIPRLVRPDQRQRAQTPEIKRGDSSKK
jgi:hypothetical protein